MSAPTVSIYVRLSDLPVHHTVAGRAANVDYAVDGSPVGVEVLDALGITIDGDPVALAHEEPCDQCGHARAFHADEIGKCSVVGDQIDCWCPEWWARP